MEISTEFHFFFLPSAYLISHPEAKNQLLSLPDKGERVKLLPIESFAAAVSDESYHVFHCPDGLLPTGWLYLRNCLSQRNVPLTCVTHTISYQSTICDSLLPMLLQKAKPLGFYPYAQLVVRKS